MNERINITWDDLDPENRPDTIEITHADLGENEGWGAGELGGERMRQHEWIERQLKLLEVMLQPAIRHTSGNLDLTDKNADQAERSAVDVASRGVTGADAEYWERYHAERKKLLDTEVEKASELYSNYVTITRVWDKPHRLQEQIAGRDALSTCLIASTLNALDVIGLDAGDSEADVIEQVGGPEAFDREGYLPLARAEAYLREKGADVRSDTVNLFTLIRHLTEGGVAIVAYGGHARMISAMEASRGSIMFKMHDPLRPDPSMISIEKLAQNLSASGVYSNLILVKGQSRG